MHETICSVTCVVLGVGVLAGASLACAFDGNSPGAPVSDELPSTASSTTGPVSVDPATATSTSTSTSSGQPQGMSSETTDAQGTSTGSDTTDALGDGSSESTGTPPVGSEACPADPSLVACWDFSFDHIDEAGILPGGTSNALDAMTSDVAWAEGPFGDATLFHNESRAYLSAPAALDLADAVSLDAWIYIDPEAADGDRRRGIFDHQGQYAMFYYPGLGVRCSGLTEVFGPMTAPEAERWMHVACTFGGGRMGAYVDGVLAAEVGFEGPLPVGGGELVALGNNTPRFDAPFLGALALVRVWDRSLTPADVASLATVE